MIIDSIDIEGFKSIRAAKNLSLAPVNVLVGSNGSGKSNFLDVFAFIQEIGTDRLRQYTVRQGGAERVLHYGSERTSQIYFRVWMSSAFDQTPELQYGVTVIPTSEDQLAVEDKWAGESSPSLWNEPHPCDPGELEYSYISRWRIYQFHDTSSRSPMRKTAQIGDNRGLRGDGSNLAAFLYLIKKKHPVEYRRIRDVVRLVAPFFLDFVLEPEELNEETIRLAWKHTQTDAYFDTSSMSDGTLRFIALATLLLQPDRLRPVVILLDEPELGLHPLAISHLAAMVRMAPKKSQIVLATQSPILLDHFSPQDVLVTERVEGATTFTRLDDSELAEWMQEYSLGQLWEKNEIGGRPTPEIR